METSSHIAGLVPAILDRVADAIVVVDGRGSIVYVNTAAAELLGYSPMALMGRPIEILLPEASRATHADVRSHFHTLPTARPMGRGLPLEARRADGSVISVDIQLEPMHEWVVASIRRASQRSSGEQELLDTLELVGQHLFAAGMSMAALRNSVPASAVARVDDTTALLDRTLELAREQRAAHLGD